MTVLNLAVKANQATVIPSLLVATLVNITQDANIEINFEDAVAIKGREDGESTQLLMDDDSSVHGTVSVVEKLIKLYPSLSSVHGDLVSQDFPALKGSLLTTSNSKKNGLPGYRTSFYRTISPSKVNCSSWIRTLLSDPTL